MWSAYDAWNEALAEEFFGGRWASRPVYLDLEDDVLARVAAQVDVKDADPSQALVDAVRPTLHLESRGSLFGHHTSRLDRWEREQTDAAPPVIAVLALLSLVAEQMRSDAELSAANYYGRFLQVLGADAQDESLRQKVIRGFSDESHQMWRSLNDWIAADSVRGKPTAYAFDFRVHVGVPMSQALVRERDRARLQELFLEARLQPGEQLAHSDMHRLLAQWLPQSSVSNTLKTLSVQPEVLDRVAEVACVELEAWTGEVQQTDQGVTRAELALLGRMRSKPRRRLDLSLGVRGIATADDVLELDAGSGSAAELALQDLEGRIRLEAQDASGWREAADGRAVSMPDFLLATPRLRTSDGAVVGRVPRRLILLERDEATLRYVEVPRARLGGEYVLLVMDSLQGKLHDALAECVRPGFRAFKPKFLAGLPAGWTAYVNVELIGITSTGDSDLASLVPVAWTQVSMTGGLKLPGRATWHLHAPPDVTASSFAREAVTAVLHVEEPHAALGQDEVRDAILGQVEGAEVFPLAGLELPAGDYRVALFGDVDDVAVGSAALRLRSADDAQGSPDDAVSFKPERLWALTASEGDRGAKGASGWTELDEVAVSLEPPSPRQLPLTHTDDTDAEQEEAPPPTAQAPQPASLASCLETGAHHFDLDSYAGRRPGAADEFGGDCRYCHLEKFFPARPRRKGKRARRRGGGDGYNRAAAMQEAARIVQTVPRRELERKLDPNVMFDAMCLVGGGDWAVLERMFGQYDERPWAAMQHAWSLSALGHIDIALDVTTLRPTRWSVAPAVLVITDHGGFLAGFRSRRLVRAVATGAMELGLHLERVSQEGAPDRLGLREITAEAAHDLSAAVARDCGLSLSVSETPARQLAQRLPLLRSILVELPTVSSLDAANGLEMWDPTSGRWTGVNHAGARGAYRSTFLPRRHWVRLQQQPQLCMDPVSKWLAALDASQPMLAYDADARRIACYLGAQPPALYERALVMCTGIAGQRAGAHVLYDGVDGEVAAMVSSKLGAPA